MAITFPLAPSLRVYNLGKMSSRPPSHLLPALDSDNEDFDQSFVSDMDNVSVAQPLWQPGLSQAAGPQGAVASSRSQQHGPVLHRQGTEAAYATTVGHGAAAGVRANTVSVSSTSILSYGIKCAY